MSPNWLREHCHICYKRPEKDNSCCPNCPGPKERVTCAKHHNTETYCKKCVLCAAKKLFKLYPGNPGLNEPFRVPQKVWGLSSKMLQDSKASNNSSFPRVRRQIGFNNLPARVSQRTPRLSQPQGAGI